MFHGKKVFVLMLVSFLLSFAYSGYSYAQEGGWLIPSFSVSQAWDDNIYLTDGDEKADWITTLSPKLTITPKLSQHKFSMDYQGDFNFFRSHTSEDSENHLSNAVLELIFNKFRIQLNNRYRNFSDRSGGEDVNRIPRTQDHVDGRLIFEFNKLDLSLGYLFQYENYRSDRGIGTFLGAPATYQDLDRLEHTGEIETAWKLWPKTALLLSARKGGILHRTGIKADSDYYDILTGIRGEPSAKSTAEFKVGYRNQGYEDSVRDFSSLIAFGSLIEKLTYRDVVRLDFLRTSYDTIYQNNAYYEVSFLGVQFEHGFTDRFNGNVALAYQLDTYPVETTEGSETKHRTDNILRAGCGLKYKTPKGLFSELKYEFLTRDSNFSEFDYKNNITTLSLGIEF